MFRLDYMTFRERFFIMQLSYFMLDLLPSLLSSNNFFVLHLYIVLFCVHYFLICIIEYQFFLIIKPTRCTNSSTYFWNRPLHVSESSSVNHQESNTIHTAIHICCADCLLASTQHNLYGIYLLLMMDGETFRNM
jgi:hypothetical protein